jgi:hypothetical protein
MPAIPTTAPTGSTLRRFANAAVGVAGVGAVVAYDISDMPEAVLKDPTMRDNWLVFARQVDPGITNLSPNVDFFPAAPAAPTELRLTMDAAAPTDVLDVEFWYIHSVTR